MNQGLQPLLDGLNDSQKDAVLSHEGALLVVAGAGTGKTRVITRRVAALVNNKIPPYQILAITFTNKAALEMRQRVEALIGPSDATLTTYHSFCARFLRKHSEKLGFTNDYTIYDRDDCLSLIGKLIKSEGRDVDSLTPAQLLDRVSGYKQEALDPAQVYEMVTNPRERKLADFYKSYDLKMRLSNAMDFDDLLMKTVQLLRKHQDICEEAQNRYRYLLIDEYQDTNRIQYEIVRLIGSHGNVCATGDPDQSIYAWRGADIRNILDFEKDFPNAKVILLEENYRSTGCILKAASAVIRNNTERKKRGLWTQEGDGEPLRLVVLDDERKEAREVSNHLKEAYEAGRPWKSNAVFYRTNAQTRVLERSLREHAIPYKLVGAVSFFKRREIKDLLAYLVLLVNPVDDQSFSRIINTPKRGLGKTTLDRLGAYARKNNLSLFESLNFMDHIEGFTDRAKKSFQSFLEIFKEIKDDEISSVRECVVRIVEKTRFEASLEADPDRVERLENMRELVTAAHEFDLNHPDESLGNFLADISLMTNAESEEGQAEGVTLMTLHSAKGLEFDHVYFLGLEEELIPHARSMNDFRNIEEERRLMYVGITRARKSLHLFYCQSRSNWGQVRWTRPSRYLKEIPEEILETQDKTSSAQFNEDSNDSEPDVSASWDNEFFDEEQVLPVKIGDRVSHERFGTGQVLTVSGRAPAVKVRVKFLTVGVRQLIWEKAPMKKV